MDNNPPLCIFIEPVHPSFVPRPPHIIISESILNQSKDLMENMELYILDLLKVIKSWKGKEIRVIHDYIQGDQWMIGGYFNLTQSPMEKKGGNQILEPVVLFQATIHDSGLVNVDTVNVLYMEQLSHFLASSHLLFRLSFPL